MIKYNVNIWFNICSQKFENGMACTICLTIRLGTFPRILVYLGLDPPRSMKWLPHLLFTLYCEHDGGTLHVPPSDGGQ